MIILDRIIVTQDGEDKLITDLEAIQTETNCHFQTCAGSINEKKQIGNNNTLPN